MQSQIDLKGVSYYEHGQSLPLYHGETLVDFRLVYETYGCLSDNQDNVVLVHHALSTHSHLRAHAGNSTSGWWQHMVGPGCAIDTDRFFVICINNLGSCYGSTGPLSPRPGGQQSYAAAFPRLSLVDIVRSQHALLTHLGIDALHAIVGPSMGGMLSLIWSLLYPQQVARLVVLSTSWCSYPCNAALRALQRSIIELDPAWNKGQYEAQSLLPGFLLARAIGHLTYRNNEELNQRFANVEHDAARAGINDYLRYNAEKFVRQFDANCYLTLTQAMDDFDLTEIAKRLSLSLTAIAAQVSVIAVNSDQLFPPWQQQALHDRLLTLGVNSELYHYACEYGHDAFLVETQGIGALIKKALTS